MSPLRGFFDISTDPINDFQGVQFFLFLVKYFIFCYYKKIELFFGGLCNGISIDHAYINSREGFCELAGPFRFCGCFGNFTAIFLYGLDHREIGGLTITKVIKNGGLSLYHGSSPILCSSSDGLQGPKPCRNKRSLLSIFTLLTLAFGTASTGISP